MAERTKAYRVYEVGGPEVLRLEDVELPAPGPGEAVVRQRAVGLNFIDIYFRTGVYKPPAFPFVPGQEGAGVVEAVGAGVTEVRPGDRVAYAGGPLGAYAVTRVLPAHLLVKLPESIDDRTAAAMMLKGLTAQYLLRQIHAVGTGDTILFHAAAGGVGRIAVRWAKHLGATVIGTVGSEDKVALARESGCDHVIVDPARDLASRVRAFTGGQGVRVVYDSIGKDTFLQSLDCLAPRGLMVSFGQSSGVVPPFDIGLLSTKGSLFLTRPSLMAYIATPQALAAAAGELFEVVGAGHVPVPIGQTFPFSEAQAAHQALAGRRTTGSTVLLV